jgi:flavin reductase
MIDRNTYRDAMARLAAAVTVVTSDGPGGLCGCTVSAVCSVSDVPPVVLVCINRSSRNNAVLKTNQRLCINILRADQQDLALQFSRAGTDAEARFDGAGWSPTPVSATGTPAPMLDGALAALDCHISDSAEVGSHTVFYCAVDGIVFGHAGAALTYFARDFHSVPEAAPASPD